MVILMQPQESGASDHISYVGMTLAEVIEIFGAPETVAVARGLEIWQDDVVFQYSDMDLFIYRDRVWQIKP